MDSTALESSFSHQAVHVRSIVFLSLHIDNSVTKCVAIPTFYWYHGMVVCHCLWLMDFPAQSVLLNGYCYARTVDHSRKRAVSFNNYSFEISCKRQHIQGCQEQDNLEAFMSIKNIETSKQNIVKTSRVEPKRVIYDHFNFISEATNFKNGNQNCEEPMHVIESCRCCNAQFNEQLILQTSTCNFCEKRSCESCIVMCTLCAMPFCKFCSTVSYKYGFDQITCIDCNST